MHVPPASPRPPRLAFLFASTLTLTGLAGCPDAPPDEGPDGGDQVDGRELDAPPPPSWHPIVPSASLSSAFGGALAVSGETLLVGGGYNASGDTPVYVYVRRAGVWVEQGRLTGGATAQTFGTRVALDGDLALVTGALANGDDPPIPEVRAFERHGETWSLAATFDPSTLPSARALSGGIAVDGDTLVIGDAGAFEANQPVGQVAHVLVRSGATWTEQATLAPPTEQPGWTYASTVAIDGDTIAVGDASGWVARHDERTGLVHTFRRIGTSWALEATLLPAFDAVWPQPIAYGAQVALKGDRLVIGVDHASPCSRVEVFERIAGTWNLGERIASEHNVCGDIASLSIALGDDRLALGAHGSTGSFPSSGAAYVHVRAGGAWTARSPSALPSLAPSAGYAIALTATSVLLGAPDERSVYEYPLAP